MTTPNIYKHWIKFVDEMSTIATPTQKQIDRLFYIKNACTDYLNIYKNVDMWGLRHECNLLLWQYNIDGITDNDGYTTPFYMQ